MHEEISAMQEKENKCRIKENVQKRGGDMKKVSLVNSVIVILLLVITILLVVIVLKLDHPVVMNQSTVMDEPITEGIDYRIINGEITITGYSGRNMDLVIPKTIEGIR